MGESEATEDAITVTAEDADADESAVLVATTAQAPVGIAAGDVYKPLESTAPHPEP